jgi:hypothetical protein
MSRIRWDAGTLEPGIRLESVSVGWNMYGLASTDGGIFIRLVGWGQTNVPTAVIKCRRRRSPIRLQLLLQIL